MRKKLLLLSVILASQTSFGQLTQANEPAVGASSTMYAITDTGTVSLAGIGAVTGSSAVWDYSSVVMENTASGSISVGDPATSPNASDFPSSTKTISQGTIVQYFNSSSTQRVSQGFVFTVNVGGAIQVPVVFSDEATLLTYPFNFGNVVNDTYTGNAVIDLGGFFPPTNAPVNGKIYTSIDGTGILKLPAEDISNVFRLTTIDTATATGVPILNSVEIIRIQHEYYDAGAIGLPIFVDAYVFVSGAGAERQILSKNHSVGLDKNSIQNVVLYPNPSNGEFTISGEFAKGNVEVTDLTGRVVYASEITSGATVKLNDVKSGVYTVKLVAGDKASVQKITIK